MSDVCPKCKAEFESYVDDTWKKYKCGTRTLGEEIIWEGRDCLQRQRDRLLAFIISHLALFEMHPENKELIDQFIKDTLFLLSRENGKGD